MKKYKHETEIVRTFLQENLISEEYIIKELAKNLIDSIDIEDLKRILNIKKIDPETVDYSLLSNEDRGYYMMLRQFGVIRYVASVETSFNKI